MNMLKKILLGILVVLLGVGGYIYYNLNIKEYDVADNEIEEIVDEEYAVELPNLDGDGETAAEGGETGDADSLKAGGTGESTEGSEIDGTVQSSASGGSSSQSGNGSSDSKVGSQGSNSTAGSANSSGSTSSGEQKTYTAANIKASYSASFDNLQAQAEARLSSLVGRAASEYKTKKANGEEISYSYFYNKYTSAANGLEAKTDAAFNSLYSALQSDLKKHGHDPSAGSEFKERYENMKKAQRSALISKAMSEM
jgi:hypothetical protein